jgi:hypothetical protein
VFYNVATGLPQFPKIVCTKATVTSWNAEEFHRITESCLLEVNNGMH